MTLPSRDGTNFAYSSGSGAASISLASVPTGDWMLLVIMTGNTGTSVTLPSGWDVLVGLTTMGTRRIAVLGRIKQSGDTVSITKGATLAMTLALVYGSGGDIPTTWQIGTGKLRATSPAETVTTTGLSITTAEDDMLVLSISGEATSATEGSLPSTSGTGWANWLSVPQIDATNIEQIRIGYKTMATAGATGNETDTYPNSQASNGWGIQIGITPSVTGSPSGLEIEWADGVGGSEIGSLNYFDGVDEFPIQTLISLPPDFHRYTVSQMMDDLANGVMVYWAHRGGSLDWSEETMHAYTQAIFHGVKVLEYSTYPTSDGVFVGMHDSTVNRTTALTGNVNSFAWSSLDGVAVDAPVADGGTVSRLEDLLETYGRTHVIVIEDKSYVNLNNILDLCEDILGAEAQEHIVVKSQGVGTNAVPTIATGRGYKTWGYYYGVDSPGFTNNSYYDMFGMDYTASAPQWANIVALGKPVFGHVVPDLTAASTCISRGAKGLQVSGVLAVVPAQNAEL